MAYRAYHTGGGRNCVFFSAASQLSPESHGRIREVLRGLNENPETREAFQEAAVQMIRNQFKAGPANLLLNSELRDYNTATKEQYIEKLLGKTDDLNNALCLRLAAHLDSSKKGTSANNYLGRERGNGAVDIYAHLNDHTARDILGFLGDNKIVDHDPALVIVKRGLDGEYLTRIYQHTPGTPPDTGKKTIKMTDMDTERFPTGKMLTDFISANVGKEQGVIGMQGMSGHCKALCDPNNEAKPGLETVRAETRKTFWQSIKGAFSGLASGIGNLFSSRRESVLSESSARPVAQPEPVPAYEGMEDVDFDFDKAMDSDVEKDNSKKIDVSSDFRQSLNPAPIATPPENNNERTSRRSMSGPTTG